MAVKSSEDVRNFEKSPLGLGYKQAFPDGISFMFH